MGLNHKRRNIYSFYLRFKVFYFGSNNKGRLLAMRLNAICLHLGETKTLFA
jgi:hypothetical protein